MDIRILHTNDLHGRLSRDNMPALLEARSQCDLYFDSGDCIKTGNLGVPIRVEPVWGLLAEARCDASVIGNRETHVIESAFHAKLKGASHPVLCANLRHKDGSRPLPGNVILEVQGRRVGVIGVSVPMVTERMRTQAASAYLWDQPIEACQRACEELRGQVDLLIALTHIGISQDRKLAEACPGLDIILGGHSHTVLERPERVGATWICQGGSHGRFFGLYRYQNGDLTGGLVAWGANSA